MNKVILKIEGMSCSGCQAALEKYLNKQKGVESATVNLVLAQASISYDDTLTIDDLNRFVDEAGYHSLGVYQEKESKKKRNSKIPFIVFAILGILLMEISMGHMINITVAPFLNPMIYPITYSLILFVLTIPFLFFGRDILKNGLKNLIKKHPNMDSLVTISVIASFGYSVCHLILILIGYPKFVEALYFESTAMIIYFIKLGRFIDQNSKEKTKEAIEDLVQITPSSALLKINNQEKEITIDEVKKGDILICKPGMKVAVDGKIIDGSAHFDEAFITGEARGKKKEKDDKVVAGSINLDGYILYEAEKIGKDSTISQIVHLVVEASNTKTKIQRLVDKISSLFVPILFGIAIFILIMYIIIGQDFSQGFIAFVTILVVACPCALGLATPLAIIVSEGVSAQKGILIKSSEILENVSKVDTILFDKTGTLTYGNLRISQVLNFSSFKEQDILKMVCSLEKHSTHPIATAFHAYARENKISLKTVSDFQNMNGIGLMGKIQNNWIYIGNQKIFKKLKLKNDFEEEARNLTKQGCSILYVIKNKEVFAIIGVKDMIRKNAKSVLNKLKAMKKDLILLTGDNEITTNQIVKDLPLDLIKTDCMPIDKQKYVKELKKNGKTVMMVGDGINDAPSLAYADIGVSFHSGTDIAANSSGVILMHDDLDNLVDLFKISKKTVWIIKENLFWAFFYNVIMITIATGLLKPWHIEISPMYASIAMTLSSLTVVFNSLRLKINSKKTFEKNF